LLEDAGQTFSLVSIFARIADEDVAQEDLEPVSFFV
jgi:hypothetical protein